MLVLERAPVGNRRAGPQQLAQAGLRLLLLTVQERSNEPAFAQVETEQDAFLERASQDELVVAAVEIPSSPKRRPKTSVKKSATKS